MKRIYIAALGVVAVLLAYFVFTQTNAVEYVQPQVIKEVIEVEKEVLSDEKRIADAQSAAQAEIEAKAQAAYDDMYTLEMAKIEAQVLLEIENEIKARRIEVEKATGDY